MYDDTDRKLIAHLRENARIKLVDLARKTGIPVSTVHERVHKLIDSDRARMVCLPDYRTLRVPLVTWMAIRVRDRDEARTLLTCSPYVNTLLETNNGADFLAECIFPGFAEQHRLVNAISERGSCECYPVIESVGREIAQVLAHKD